MMSPFTRPEPNAVHLHVVDLDRSAGRLDALSPCLSSDERARAARLIAPEDGKRFSRARVFLRSTLSRYVGVEAVDVDFVYGPNGKPLMREDALPESGRGLVFNLTHSRNMCAVAVASSCDVGVDIEFRRSFRPGLAERFFSKHEVEALNQLEDGARTEAFFRCWTRKEAVVKALGDGLMRSLKSFDVAIDDVSEPNLLRLEGVPARALEDQWSLFSFQPDPGAWGALACRADKTRITRLVRFADAFLTKS